LQRSSRTRGISASAFESDLTGGYLRRAGAVVAVTLFFDAFFAAGFFTPSVRTDAGRARLPA
jgi:hypothetical protein